MEHTEALFREVLLVEDEAAHALLIERALKGLVVSICKCGSVADARKKLAERSFDLVVSDLNLPDLRSEAVVTALKGDAPQTPIIVLTSSASVTDGVAAMRAGAKDFLVKNFDATFRDVLSERKNRLQKIEIFSERRLRTVTMDSQSFRLMARCAMRIQDLRAF